MADYADNIVKSIDATTGMVTLQQGCHLTFPASQDYAAKQAALQGFDQWQEWLQANMPAGPAKTWHTITAPQSIKQNIWLAAKI